MTAGLSVLLVEDEPPTLDELVHQLGTFEEVGEVVPVGSALDALRLLRSRSFDAAFLDVSMPGLDGMELAGVLTRLAAPPVIVFVTASEAHAVAAYGVGAVDYLLKPVARDRIAEALRRVGQAVPAEEPSARPDDLDVLKAEGGGRTRFVRREQVHFAEARGDYVRLRTAQGDFSVRLPLSTLEESWAGRGFLRVHRGFLVALAAVVDLRTDAVGQLVVHTPSGDAPVSRRHARRLQDLLMEAARRGELGDTRL
ncbi:MAG TPA: DNA-binding response regulator [Streptomyces sp.]|nr:DNA-binding response regulator [Streptomyces sp.]